MSSERFEYNKSYREAGEALGMVHEQVRRIEEKAFRKMRRHERRHYLIHGEDGWRTYEKLREDIAGQGMTAAIMMNDQRPSFSILGFCSR